MTGKVLVMPGCRAQRAGDQRPCCVAVAGTPGPVGARLARHDVDGGASVSVSKRRLIRLPLQPGHDKPIANDGCILGCLPRTRSTRGPLQVPLGDCRHRQPLGRPPLGPWLALGLLLLSGI